MIWIALFGFVMLVGLGNAGNSRKK